MTGLEDEKLLREVAGRRWTKVCCEPCMLGSGNVYSLHYSLWRVCSVPGSLIGAGNGAMKLLLLWSLYANESKRPH